MIPMVVVEFKILESKKINEAEKGEWQGLHRGPETLDAGADLSSLFIRCPLH